MALLSKINIRNFNTKRSGQSAIEYLMTYGWMLLVVAIAGGAIFSIAGDQSVESITGFSGDVEVDDFGVTENGLDLVLRNMDSNTVDVNEVTVSDDEIQASADGASISVGSTEVVTVSNAQPSTETTELDVNINYDVGGLTGLETSGVIVAEIEISGVGFTVSDTNPEPDQEVYFEDTSNVDDLDGDFEERRWDFGDDTTEEDADEK